ncbi:MAG: hypothetical protein IT561_08300 [Alphaproteobacteria bacterium]|nr:hypothetical protein [Alphaproteobacteria bacterium]
MAKAKINLVVWCGVAAVAFMLWFFAGRTRLHLVDPLAFIGLVAVAAAVLTALVWWEARAGSETLSGPGDGPPSK